MYMCVYIYIYIYIYICRLTGISVYLSVWIMHECPNMFVCMHTNIYIDIQECMYVCICQSSMSLHVCSKICIRICLHVCLYTHIQIYESVCMYVYNKWVCMSTPVSLNTCLINVTDKYGCHMANMSHTAITLYGHIDPNKVVYVCQNTTNCSICFTCYCHICAHNKYASQMP